MSRLAAGGSKVGALTNGAQLKGKVADAFAAHATWIRVSIDGWDGESYARYRNVAETEFDKVMGNLRDFSRRGSDCLLGASIIVDETNGREIHKLAERLKACGVPDLTVIHWPRPTPCSTPLSAGTPVSFSRGMRSPIPGSVSVTTGVSSSHCPTCWRSSRHCAAGP